MKIHLSLCAMLLFSFNLIAQTDYSGIYSYSFPVNRELSDLKPGKEDGGASGELIVAKNKDAQYVFWLNVNRGWPSYNNGFMTGEFTVSNGKARYAQIDEYAENKEYCVLNFVFKTGAIEINSEGSEHCGFGHAVYADGTFRRSKKVLTAAYLYNSLEGMGEVKTVKSTKALIYKDSNLSQPTGQYFIKNDRVYAGEVSAGGIFFQYLTAKQKYIEGWLRKEDL